MHMASIGTLLHFPHKLGQLGMCSTAVVDLGGKERGIGRGKKEIWREDGGKYGGEGGREGERRDGWEEGGERRGRKERGRRRMKDKVRR